MMITIFSFITSVILCSILTVSIYFFRNNRILVRWFGVMSIVLLYAVCLVRMVFPFEFSFTSVVVTPAVFNDLYSIITNGQIRFMSISLNTVQIFLALWAIVSFIILLYFAFFYIKYLKSFKKIAKYKSKDDYTNQIFETVIGRSKRKINVSIMYSPEITMPMGVGVFRHYILLPDREYGDDELFYTLLHEYTHFLNRDLLVKMLIHIYCCVFWWNPTVYLLRKDLEQTLEIKCDLTITKTLNKDEKVIYLQTIASAVKKAIEIDFVKYQAKVVSQLAGNKSAVMERFEIIAIEEPKYRVTIKSAIFYMFFISVFTLSYTIVLQPKGNPPQSEIIEEDGDFELTPQNTYILETKDGRYILKTPDGRFDEISEYSKNMMVESGFEIKKE